MKSLFAISLLAALLWQPLFQTGYIGYWEINKETIAKTECINRFKPMMHCNGKCQLYRQLKKAADEEAENNKLPIAVLKIKSPDTFIAMVMQWQPCAVAIFVAENNYLSYSSTAINGYVNTLLQPPQC